MKVFHLTLEFDLEEKPEWIDSFRQKYGEPYSYHITLKYPTLIKEVDLPKLTKEVQSLAEVTKVLVAEFDKYFFDKTKNGNLIMVSAKHNEDLIRLQKLVMDRLSAYGKTKKPHYKDFEINFKPHIALARKLSDKNFLEARNQLKKQIYCKATITKLALTTVNEGYSSEDVVSPKNSLYFYLK